MIGELYALAAAICWSIAAVFYKKGIGIGAIPIVLIRTFFAMSFLLLMYLIIEGAIFNFTLLGFAFLNIGGFLRLILGGYAYMKGLEYISISRFVPILFTFPLITVFLSHLFLKEEIRSNVIYGTIFIVLGVWMLSKGKNIGDEKNVKFGIMFAVLAAFLYAFSIIATKTGLNEIDPFQSALISMPIPFTILYIIHSIEKGHKTIFKFKKEAYVLLGLGGIFGMGLGSYFFFMSLSSIGTAKATSLAAITPFISSMLAILTLKEKIKPAIIIGTASTVIGMWIILT